MPQTTTPRYLKLLTQAWIAHDQPSSRKLGEATGLSYTTISDTLRARVEPSLRVMRLMAKALSFSEQQAQEIMDAYNAHLQARTVVPTSRGKAAENQIAEALREGLHDVAEAIRSLKR